MTSRVIVWTLAGPLLALSSCASTPTTTTNAFTGETTPKRAALRGPSGPVDDRSMCDWKGRKDREASEIAGPGSLKPNVRRVYLLVGVGESQKKILVCREVDTNFDGVKDVVRRYNDKGESVHEESDTDYDGRIDTWITFSRGKLAEVELDNDRDGKPDEWKSYSEGRLSRIKRDQNRDGKPDVWEIYREGKLERMGVDLDADERVDRWDHDTEARRRAEEAERKKEEEAKKREAEKREAEKADADKDGDEREGEPKGSAPSAEKKDNKANDKADKGEKKKP
ncbi:hypothetical protein [Polyangium mundeleinium]|uniref:Lipoprotein n=1 Tax=Polyangium mundeleinium TaxID=2995306 RepID=A0ABT5EV72_9BACT|nr:hypothetical protein [Polyangium mundeleinium]MDC0745730.1 hypothetical protein [Polyangium mundeleinium]